jgi:sugar lactone lactonase YvrE
MSPMRNRKVLLDGLAFPEGPRWHDGKLFFSDMHAHKVIAVDLDGRAQDVVEVPNRPSGLGWLPDGRMLVVSMVDRKVMRQERDGLRVHADLSKLASGICNDMVVDKAGRAYVGNFGYDFYANEPRRNADLILIAPDGKASVVAPEMQFPNGSVITPDGKTLIVGESMGARLTAFDIQSDGTLTNRRLWAQFSEGMPDGIALDSEGAVWAASPFTNEVLRIFEGGRVAERIKTEQLAIACALGGPERKTLFILTAPSVEPEACRANPVARVEITQVEAGGAGLP